MQREVANTPVGPIDESELHVRAEGPHASIHDPIDKGVVLPDRRRAGVHD